MIRTPFGITFAALLLLLLSHWEVGCVVSAAENGNETLAQVLDWTDLVTRRWEWEWVLVRIDGTGGLESADLLSSADTRVVVSAVNAREPPVHFHGDAVLSRFTFLPQMSTDTPKWYEIGMVAYARDTVSELEVVLQELDLSGDVELIKTTIGLPLTYDQWTNYTLRQDDYEMTLSLRKSQTPLFTETDQLNMDLTEVLFDLEDGSVASLVYHTEPRNEKAVLYFPGRSDSFAHPHVLQMYQTLGYDLYSLDARFCGRTRRFLTDDTYKFGHSIDDFDRYAEEIRRTLDHIHQTKNYTTLLSHSHSTGALVALNYALLAEEEPFDGHILNGPFLDWGYVSWMEETLLENADILDGIGMNTTLFATGLSPGHSRNWILNRYNTTWRPIIQLHVTTEFAQAATRVHEKILARGIDRPITETPVLLIASLGDDTIFAAESADRMPHIASNYTQVIMEYNSHDVTYSRTKELNDAAIEAISSWIESAF